jgi:hypothetical protein
MNAEDVDRLLQIKDEIKELAHEIKELAQEAYGLTPQDSKRIAKAYWYAQLIMALDDDHEFLGSGSHTLQDTIDDAEEGAR